MPNRVIAWSIVVVVCGTAAADDTAATRLVGNWECIRSEKALSGASWTIDFRKDGTATTSHVVGKNKPTLTPHTWRIEGDVLTMTTKGTKGAKDRVEPYSILKLTGTALIVKGKDNVEEEYKRLK